MPASTRRATPRRLLRVLLALLVALPLVLAGDLAPTRAAPIVPFGVRFQANDNGTIAIFGNNLMTCVATDARCAGTRAGTVNLNNNSLQMVNLDVDGDPSTFNSSGADVAGPPASDVLWAGLYWGARLSAGSGGVAGTGNSRTMLLRTPGAGAYTPVASQATFGPTSGDRAYQEFANVTTTVQSAGAGTYFGANVVGGTGQDRYAGWSLVVVYRSPELPLRNLTVFDGFTDVGQGNPQTIDISGFLAPLAGPVETQLGLVAYEGDFATSGDQAQLNSTLLSTSPLSRSNNFFNGTNDDNGRSVANRTPADVNMLGFDRKNLGASGIANGATSATIALSSTGDRYFPGVVTTAIKLYAPDFSTSTKSVTNLAGRDPAEPGDELEYTLTYDNTGQDPATDVVLTDPLPLGTTFVPGSLEVVSGANSGPKTDGAGDDQAEYVGGATDAVRFRLGTGAGAAGGGTLQVDASSQVRFRVQVELPAAGTTLTNAAALAYTADTLNLPLTYRVTPASIPVTTVADLSLAKTVAPDPADAGGTVTSTLTVDNAGPNPATDTVVVDELPPGVTFVSATASAGACTESSGVVTCSVGTVGVGTPVTISVVVSVPSSSTVGSIVNAASVSSATADLDLENNAAGASAAVVRAADLSVTKTAASPTVVPGTTTSFTVTVRNDGPSDATNVTISDSIPDPNLTITGATLAGASCTTTIDVARCIVPTLPAGATVTMIVDGLVPPDAPGGLPLLDTATATADTPDRDPTDNDATTTITTAPPQADIATTKTGGVALAGGEITYTVAVVNNGPSDATAVDLVDPLPAGFTATRVTTTRGTCALGPPVTCDFGDLPGPDAEGRLSQAVVTIVASIPADFPPGPAINSAIASTTTADPDPVDNTGSLTSEVTAVADLSVTKTANPVQPAAGENVTYTVTVTNAGPSTARDAQLTDDLPDGLTLVSVDPPTCTGFPELSCPVGNLDPGGTLTVTVVMNVPSGFDLATGAVNTASITSTTPDPVAGNDTASATVTSRAIADLQAVKWDTTEVQPPPGTPPATFRAGELVTYYIAVANLGPSDASTARIVDTLPARVTFVSVDAPPGFCTFTAPQLVCEIPDFPPFVGVFVPVTVRVDADLADGALLTNSIEVGFTDPTRVDPVSSNNFDALTNPVVAAADLNVVKSTYSLDLPSFEFTVPSAAPAGTPTGYFIDIRNDGPSTARDVTLVDTSTLTDFFLGQVRIVKPGGEVIDITASCTFGRGDLQCPIGDLPVFAPGDAAWRVQVDGVTLSNAQSGSYLNTARLTSATPDSDLSDNEAQAPITVTAPVSTLTIDKTDVGDNGLIPDTLVPGTEFAYQLSVANVVDLTREGAADADDVIVTDTLPPGLTPTAVTSSQGTCTITLPSTVTCDLGTVRGPGRVPEPPPVLITITGAVATNATGPLTNTATVTSPISAPATDSLELPVVPVGDLSITKLVDSPEAAAGSTIGFSLVVTNAGPSDAVGVDAGEILPPELTLDAALTDPSCVYDAALRFVSCALGTLPVGETRTIRVVGRLDPGQAPGTLTNRAAVGSSVTGDTNIDNNLSEVPVTITQAADLVVTKQADSETVAVGDNVTYTLTVTNEGPSNAPEVVLDDTLPPGTVLVSATGEGGLTCAEVGGAVRCEAPELAAGEVAQATVVVNLPSGLAAGDLVNVARASSAIPDPDPSRAIATSTVSAFILADTAITKTLLTVPPVAGAPVTFALEVVNRGPQAAPNVVLSDSLTAGLTFLSATVEVGTGTCELTRPEDVDVVTCEVGSLAVGATARATITVDTHPGLTAIENAASVGSGALDELSDDNVDVLGFTLEPPPIEPELATIGGVVWRDDDRDAVVDTAESRLASARVEIANVATGATTVATTGSDGVHRTEVTPGEYRVTLDLTSVGSRLTTTGTYTVIVAAGEVRLGTDFGIVEDAVTPDGPDGGGVAPDGVDGGAGALPFTGGAVGTRALIALVFVGVGAVILRHRRPTGVT